MDNDQPTAGQVAAARQSKIDHSITRRVLENATPKERTALIGDNMPPASADPLRDRLAETYASLLTRRDELLSGADRAPTEISDEDTAGKFADFIKQIAACIKNTDTHRVAEKEVYLAGGRTVDGWFKKIADPLAEAKQKIEARLTVYQRQKADKERRAREEAERVAREEAERAAKAAAEAEAAIKAAPDLQAAIVAEAAATQAAADAEKAKKAAEAKPAELSRSRGDYGATASLRAEWIGELVDRASLDLETIRPHLPEDAINKAIRSFVRAGGRELRGAKIYERQHTVVR